jgi:hypothetical protein
MEILLWHLLGNDKGGERVKREALFHPKMLDLAARLNISQAQAIGHITMLVNWTADFAIQGDIGKWPNGAIARGAGWDASPDTFVDALTEAGWLDPHETHRLLLHDWPDHAERWVKSKLSSLGLTFCMAYGGLKCNVSKDVSRDTSASTSGDPPRDRTKPNQTEPNRTSSSSPNPSGQSDEDDDEVSDLDLLDSDNISRFVAKMRKFTSVRKARTALEAAASRNCTVGDIRGICNHYVRQGWDDPARLYQRIVDAEPGEDPTDINLWPPSNNGERKARR